MLSRLRIVLISPSGPTNVGSVARIMANMGLSDLVIVAPRCDLHDPGVAAYASHGYPVIEQARVVDDIPAALADCVTTFVTSSRLGMYRRQAAITPAEAAPEALRHAAQGRVALAFGREDYGLKTHELLHFDRVITIPADDTYPVLNLAMAVTVCCYELRQAWLRQAGEKPLPKQIDLGRADDRRKQVFFDRLFDALTRIEFFADQNPDHLKYGLRHLFGRMELGVNEIDILIGMASQIRWYAEHHPDRRDPPAESSPGATP